jgi:DNA-binding response OmpR family regulator
MSSQPKILVVDDEPEIRTILREMLEHAGNEVTAAADGEQAWPFLDATDQDFSAIVLDRKMPGLDGISLLRRIKGDGRLDCIPVIMVTALGMEEDIVEGLNSGAYYYLLKPFKQQILLSIVNTAIKDHRRYRSVIDQLHQGMSTLHMLHTAEYRFRTPEQANTLAAMLSNAFRHPERVALGLQELFLNAVEHGNLNLGYDIKGQLQKDPQLWLDEISRRLADPCFQNRKVRVRLTHRNDAIQVEVEDEGDGFDWKNYLEVSLERALHTHGRGIALAKALSFDTLEYRGTGNRVRVSAAGAAVEPEG